VYNSFGIKKVTEHGFVLWFWYSRFSVSQNLDFFSGDFAILFLGCTGRLMSHHVSWLSSKGQVLSNILLKGVSRFIFSLLCAWLCDSWYHFDTAFHYVQIFGWNTPILSLFMFISAVF
jgi:hypothetical protein